MSDPREFVHGMVHEPTQTEDERCVDLTVGHVYEVGSAGRIDFGGDEYEEPAAEPIEPERLDEADDYGWWELDGGTYLIGHNESLQAAETDFLLQPHPRLLALGAIHPTTRVTELPRMPLSVPDAGVAIKENARVSMLLRTYE